MKNTHKLTPAEAALVKARLQRGDYQHEIAADFRVNQGRISEIKTGKRFKHVEPVEVPHGA